MTSERHVARKGGSFKVTVSKVDGKSGFVKLIFELVQILIIICIENSFAVLPVVSCLCCEQCPYDPTSRAYKIVLTLIEAEYYCLCYLFH